jgi:HK97 family phage prohead protease
MTTNKLQMRSLISELRAAGSGGDDLQLIGYPARFAVESGALGNFKETVDKNCFNRTLRQRDPDSDDYDEDEEDIKCLRDHDPSLLLGRTSNGSLKLSTDARGLKFVVRLNPKMSLHRDVHEALRTGLMNSRSFAFRCSGDDGEAWEEKTDADGKRYVLRTLKNVELADVSVLGMQPAYPDTSVDARALSSFTPDEIADRARKLRAPAVGGQIAREQREHVPVTDAERGKKAEGIAQKIHDDEVRAWMEPTKFPS